MMKQIAQIIARRPLLVLGGILLITVVLGSGLGKLETRNNQDSELPEDDPIVVTNDYLEEVFGKKDVIMIGVESENVFSKETLQKIIDISSELEAVDGVIADEITSLSTINNMKGRDWGLEVGPLMEELPADKAEIDQLREEVGSNRLLKGRIVSEDGKFTAILANVAEGFDQATVYNQVTAIAQKYSGPEQFYLAGGPIQSQEIDMGIQNDVNLLLPLALLLVLIGYFLAFGNWQGVVLPFLVVILSIVWTMGLMGHIGFPITVVSSALPMLMVAIASSYGIHVLHRYYEEVIENPEDRRAAVAATVRNIGPAVLMTGITSALGSATLLIFKVNSIQEFGIITALGIVSTLIISIALIPALLALLKPRARKEKKSSQKFDALLIRLADFSLRRKGALLVATVVLMAISVVGIMKIRVGTDFIEYFPQGHPLRITFEEFNENLGGARTMEVMIEGDEMDAVKNPELLQKIAAFQAFAESQPGVGSTSSFADIIARMHREMNGGDPAFEKIPDSRELIAQYLLLYSMSGDPGDFSDLVDYDYQRAKIRLMITTSEQDDHRRLYESFKGWADTNLNQQAKIDFGGEVMFWLAQVRYIVMGKVENIILAIVTVLFFCIIVFRSIPGGLLSIVPLTLSTMLTFGLMGFLGIRLETGTAIITAIGIGIGVDFAIHYLSRFREEMARVGDIEKATRNTMVTSGKAIMYDVSSNILGFVVFIFSGFVPLQYFGWLISLTMITVSFASLVIYPALFSLVKPKFIYGNKADKKEEKEAVLA